MELIAEYARVFLVGGLFCAAAQVLIDRTRLTPARILVGYAVAGVVLGALGVYEPLVDYAHSGATVPLTGFGYLISRGVRETVAREGFLGILKAPLTAAAGGICASMIAGLLAAVIFDSKAKE